MSIEILPARLANQIAAGEVVERPASVVKELVENSLDAGATSIKIDIEKGGSKRIRIIDNGCGIVKDELTLALSRHATSKIKNLSDLEAICSLGFRGEALASISSVSRLSLTSKPENQDKAWQACAQGRDMDVTVQPAAHPNGTTIDVVDLFFNTPARRKFLRTEKTEFSHVEEVIKRIALARFDVSFVLTHNGKIIRQYRIASDTTHHSKRVAQVCGKAFIDNSILIDCQHDGLTLTGWIATPNFSRSQNDLCYSYVNGRMMRDKLINHAIRQSYQDMLSTGEYPAFVLFLELNARDVDVNVHPAKHEVRFHQARYVHDFIYSVCHQALTNVSLTGNEEHQVAPIDYVSTVEKSRVNISNQEVREYVAPLKANSNYDAKPRITTINSDKNTTAYSGNTLKTASQNYQELMSPLKAEDKKLVNQAINEHGLSSHIQFQFIAPAFAMFVESNNVRLLSLKTLDKQLQTKKIESQWYNGLTSQPLLLPVKLALQSDELRFIESYNDKFNQIGIVIQKINHGIQIREFPALLRKLDVTTSFTYLLSYLQKSLENNQALSDEQWQVAIVNLLINPLDNAKLYDNESIIELYNLSLQLYPSTFIQEILLNSVEIDLTSAIAQLK